MPLRDALAVYAAYERTDRHLPLNLGGGSNKAWNVSPFVAGRVEFDSVSHKRAHTPGRFKSTHKACGYAQVDRNLDVPTVRFISRFPAKKEQHKRF